MKTLRFITAALTIIAVGLSAGAQSAETDTVRYSFVTTGGQKSPIILSSKSWNIRLLFKPPHSRNDHFSTESMKGIYAGGLIPLGDHFPVTGGWEIGVKNIINVIWSAGKGRPSLSLGAGLGWKIQTVGHGHTLALTHGHLITIPVAGNATDPSSRIKHFHWTVPLTLSIPIRKTFALNLGGELHLNTYTTATSSYNVFSPEEGFIGKQKWIYKGLHQRLATLEINAALGWTDCVAAYVSWAPMRPWAKGYGPQYRALAVGAIINM